MSSTTGIKYQDVSQGMLFDSCVVGVSSNTLMARYCNSNWRFLYVGKVGVTFYFFLRFVTTLTSEHRQDLRER